MRLESDHSWGIDALFFFPCSWCWSSSQRMHHWGKVGEDVKWRETNPCFQTHFSVLSVKFSVTLNLRVSDFPRDALASVLWAMFV
jgi:hypothetical protein